MLKKNDKRFSSLLLLLVLHTLFFVGGLFFCFHINKGISYATSSFGIYIVLLGLSFALNVLSLFLAAVLVKDHQYAISLINKYTNSSTLPKQQASQAQHRKSELIQAVNQLEDSISRIYSERILAKQAELAALQSQINPHFLYNTLDCIRGQALQENMPQLAEMTEALSTFFRYSISTKDDFVTLEQELDNVQNYFSIQQYRFGNRFRMKYIFDPSEQPIIFGSLLPKLTLQPIIENAIFHGLEPKEDLGTITIRAHVTEQRLLLVVSDNGVGIDEITLSEIKQRLFSGNRSSIHDNSHSTGIALANVNARIRLYFGDMYGLTINSTKGFGTDINIVLPITQNNEYLKETDQAWTK